MPDHNYEPVAKELKEENSNEEYAIMELPYQGTLRQRMMHHHIEDKIQCVNAAGGPELITLWLQERYLHLRVSPKAVQLLIREQSLDSLDRP